MSNSFNCRCVHLCAVSWLVALFAAELGLLQAQAHSGRPEQAVLTLPNFVVVSEPQAAGEDDDSAADFGALLESVDWYLNKSLGSVTSLALLANAWKREDPEGVALLMQDIIRLIALEQLRQLDKLNAALAAQSFMQFEIDPDSPEGSDFHPKWKWQEDSGIFGLGAYCRAGTTTAIADCYFEEGVQYRVLCATLAPVAPTELGIGVMDYLGVDSQSPKRWISAAAAADQFRADEPLLKLGATQLIQRKGAWEESPLPGVSGDSGPGQAMMEFVVMSSSNPLRLSLTVDSPEGRDYLAMIYVLRKGPATFSGSGSFTGSADGPAALMDQWAPHENSELQPRLELRTLHRIGVNALRIRPPTAQDPVVFNLWLTPGDFEIIANYDGDNKCVWWGQPGLVGGVRDADNRTTMLVRYDGAAIPISGARKWSGESAAIGARIHAEEYGTYQVTLPPPMNVGIESTKSTINVAVLAVNEVW